MTIPDDGTCCGDMTYLESLPLLPAVRDRLKYGRGYDDDRLEEQRRAAIDWMRKHSKHGWVLDRMMKKGAT